MDKINITLRLPKPLAEYIEKKKNELIKKGFAKKEVSNQSIIEGLIAYCKEIEDVN